MLDDNLEKENRAAFRQLCKCLKTEKPLAMVVAGLSAQISYPTWGGLLEELHKEVHADRDLNAERLRLIREDDDLLFRAGLYRQHMGEEAYKSLLKRIFNSDRQHPIDATLKQFVELGFSHFFTTN